MGRLGQARGRRDRLAAEYGTGQCRIAVDAPPMRCRGCREAWPAGECCCDRGWDAVRDGTVSSRAPAVSAAARRHWLGLDLWRPRVEAELAHERLEWERLTLLRREQERLTPPETWTPDDRMPSKADLDASAVA